MSFLLKADLPVEIYGPGWKKEERPSPRMPHRGTAGKARDTGRWRPGSLGSYLTAIFRNVNGMGLKSGLARSARQLSYRNETRTLDPLFSPFARGPIPVQDIASALGMAQKQLHRLGEMV